MKIFIVVSRLCLLLQVSSAGKTYNIGKNKIPLQKIIHIIKFSYKIKENASVCSAWVTFSVLLLSKSRFTVYANLLTT
jgi:hypothetical protein